MCGEQREIKEMPHILSLAKGLAGRERDVLSPRKRKGLSGRAGTATSLSAWPTGQAETRQAYDA